MNELKAILAEVQALFERQDKLEMDRLAGEIKALREWLEKRESG